MGIIFRARFFLGFGLILLGETILPAGLRDVVKTASKIGMDELNKTLDEMARRDRAKNENRT